MSEVIECINPPVLRPLAPPFTVRLSHVDPSASFARGFTAIKFNAAANDASLATPAAPPGQ